MKSSNLEKAFEKNVQKARLLVLNSDFQKKVKTLRKKWNIPEKGFKQKKKASGWNAILIEETDKYLAGQDFKKKLRELHSKREELLNQRKTNKIKEAEKELSLTIPINDFKKDLLDIIKEFKATSLGVDFQKSYLLTNKIIVPGGLTIQTRSREETSRALFIKVDETTTTKDLMREWKDVKVLKEILFGTTTGRFKKMKKFKRNKRILELTEQGLSGPDIAKKITEEFGKSVMTYPKIAKIRQRFKKKVYPS